MRSGARGGDGVKEEEEEDRKPVIEPGVHVTLKVQDTEGRTVERTVRRTQKLQVVMDVMYGTGRFLYDGGRLSGGQTPTELEMEEGDEIDFFTELLGGGVRPVLTVLPCACLGTLFAAHIIVRLL